MLFVPVFAEVAVGLKEGDWIEYSVTYTGTPPENYPRMDKIEI